MQKFTGLQYLKIDIASNYGLDKATWDERLTWFEDNKAKLPELLSSAAEPALFFAGVQAYEAAIKGTPSGYPISLDATSSGLQLLACLTGDRKAAQLCNVVNVIDPNTGKPYRMDAYTAVYRAMLELIGEESKITRNDAKNAVMTALYGSKAVPKKVFGEGSLLNVFYDTMKTLSPAAWELNETMPMFWQSENLVHSWTLPDNFHVHVKVMAPRTDTIHFLNEPFDVVKMVNQPTEQGRSLGANTIHSLDGFIVREMERRCNYDAKRVRALHSMLTGGNWGIAPSNEDAEVELTLALWAHYKRTGYLSARILDVLTDVTLELVDKGTILALIYSLPAKPFEIISIHDCFRCLPNYGNDLRQQYTHQLVLIAQSNLLQAMLSDIIGRHIEVEKLDNNLWKEIEHAEYALS